MSGLLDSLSQTQAVAEAGVKLALANAIHLVFVIAFVAAALGMVAAFFTPHRELEKKTDLPKEGESSAFSAD